MSNWGYIRGVLLADAGQFETSSTSIDPWQLQAKDPPLPTKRLFDVANKLGYDIYFITGRPDKPEIRTATEKNLREKGFDGYTHLYMTPPDRQSKSAVPFKSGTRKQIEQNGHRIVLNMGDQMSDLSGGYALRRFKLPNPFYFVP